MAIAIALCMLASFFIGTVVGFQCARVAKKRLKIHEEEEYDG